MNRTNSDNLASLDNEERKQVKEAAQRYVKDDSSSNLDALGTEVMRHYYGRGFRLPEGKRGFADVEKQREIVKEVQERHGE